MFSCILLYVTFFSIAPALLFYRWIVIMLHMGSRGINVLLIYICSRGVDCETFHESVWHFQFSFIFCIAAYLLSCYSIKCFVSVSFSRHYIAIFSSFILNTIHEWSWSRKHWQKISTNIKCVFIWNCEWITFNIC